MLFAALITFVLAACVTGMICLGAAITYKGFRGRLIDAHCHCGRCGYDLTGHRHRTARCPECGSNLGLPGMMRRSIRRPQKRLITLGLSLIIFNVGGLTGFWKIGQLRSASANLTAAPGLGTGGWEAIAMPPTNQWADFDPGPDGEADFGKSSAQSNDSTHQLKRIHLQFVDATIQLPPLRRDSAVSVTSAMSRFDRPVWSGLQNTRFLIPTLSNNAVHLEPGSFRSPLRPVDLTGPRFESLHEVPSMNIDTFSSTEPARVKIRLDGQFSGP